MSSIFIIIIIVISSFFIWLNIQSNKKKDNISRENPNSSTKNDQELHDAVKYLKKHPKNILVLIHIARKLYKLGSYEQAVSYVNKFLKSNLEKIHSLKIKALILAADCMCKLKNIDSAETYIQKGYKLDSTNIEILKRLTKFRYGKEDFVSVIELSKSMLVIAPDLFEGYFYFGISNYQLGNWEEALKNLNIASSINVGDFIVTFTLGKVYNQLNDHKKALTYFTNAAKMASNESEHADVIYQEGCILKNIGELEKAETNFKIVLKESPIDEVRLLSLMSIIEIEKSSKNVNKVIFYIEEYLKIKPGNQRYLKDLEYYRELSSNQIFCDIELIGESSFLALCIEIAKILDPPLEISHSTLIDAQSVEIIAAEKDTHDNKKVIIDFIRTSNPIGIIPITNTYAKMNEISAKRCQIITDSTYTEEALLFAQMRTVDLTAKKGLITLLNLVIKKREAIKLNSQDKPNKGNATNNNN